MTTPQEIHDRRAAYDDDADNVRQDYPGAIRTIVTAVRDLAATERKVEEQAQELALARGAVERWKERADSWEAMHREDTAALAADIHRLRAEIADRESERADLRDRVTKAEATIARVEALIDDARPSFGGLTCNAIRAALEGDA